MTYKNDLWDSDSVNLGSNPSPPATASADVPGTSRARSDAEQPELTEHKRTIGRTRVGTARPKALDLFCGAGGASMGLHRAGFDVTGVDIRPQPRYPFRFVQADALNVGLGWFDFYWASPPCQKFCALATREDLSHYPDLIDPVRQELLATCRPFVIENVPQAPVRLDLMLCGAMFGLRSYRHRHFECSFPIAQPCHPKHAMRVNRRGENRRAHWARGGFITITGDVGVYCGPEAMGIDWMSGNEMSEAIPPAYAEYIGRAALEHLAAEVAA